MSKGSGEIKHPNDENHSGQQKKESIKPLRYVQDTRKQTIDADDTSNSSPHTSELEGTTTRKLGDSTTRKLGSEEWKQQQLDDLWQGLGRSRITDMSGNNLTTKELRAEVTQELDDTTQIVEVSKENQPPSSLSPEQKAKNRRFGNKLPTDQMRHALGPIHNR